MPFRVLKQPPADPIQPPSDSQSNPAETVRISYLTEQTSHHPPVSAYHAECPARGISARGFDQLSAKFTGTAIRVVPGNFNLGIFVTLHNRGDEEYQLTHPDANLGGLLRGSLSISVADTCFVTCCGRERDDFGERARRARRQGDRRRTASPAARGDRACQMGARGLTGTDPIRGRRG